MPSFSRVALALAFISQALFASDLGKLVAEKTTAETQAFYAGVASGEISDPHYLAILDNFAAGLLSSTDPVNPSESLSQPDTAKVLERVNLVLASVKELVQKPELAAQKESTESVVEETRAALAKALEEKPFKGYGESIGAFNILVSLLAAAQEDFQATVEKLLATATEEETKILEAAFR